MSLLNAQTRIVLRRGIRRGVLTLRRERGWVTALCTLTGIMVLAQLLLVGWVGTGSAERLLRSQLELRLQVQEGAADQSIQELIVALRQLPSVETVVYVTREQAYERERSRDPETISFLEEFGIPNPFLDTLAVTLRSLDDYEEFAAFVRLPTWKAVVDPAFLSQATDQETEVREMLRLMHAGELLVLGFLGLTGGVLLFLTVELVRRRALLRKEEVFVERLVGAQELSILTPFAVEAALLLSISFVLSVLIVVMLAVLLPVAVPSLGAGGSFAALRGQAHDLLASSMPPLLLFALLLLPIVAAGGTYLGMRSSK